MSRHLSSWQAWFASAWVLLALLSGCSPIIPAPVSPSPCATNNGGCAANAICSASLGSDTPTCSCPAGFMGDGKTCTEGDACSDNNGGCDSNATCTSVNKVAHCACNEGFEGDGTRCSAIDRCLINNGGCGSAETATCRSQNGQVSCDCHDGYTMFGTTCVAVCSMNNNFGSCRANSTCVSHGAEIECPCLPGYQEKGTSCVKDPCTMDNGGCGANDIATCSSSAGTATCTCKPGYQLVGSSCVDSCTRQICPQHSTCGHAPDQSTVCTCDVGFLPVNDSCAPDPCSIDNGGCGTTAAATCSGTPTTGATCTCNSGYRKVGLICVDPCTSNNGGCDARASCSVNPATGNPVCTCLPGYEPNGNTCVADPCATNNGGCGSATVAVCTSSAGIPSCACRAGYALNQMTHTCVDVCQLNNGGCTAHSDCAHQPNDSSVVCTCSAGYQLKNGACVADPCLTNNGGCGSTDFATCSSSGGVATCTCGTGYGLQGGTCVDACQISNGGCNAQTSTCGHSSADNAVVCNCLSDSLPGGNNTCFKNRCLEVGACDASEDCTPSPGSYSCACKENYVPNTVGPHCKPLVSSIAAGGNHLSCVTKHDGTLLCAGNGAMGPLVSQGASVVNAFTPVTGNQWGLISAGAQDVCGLTTAGALLCWHQPTSGSAPSEPTDMGSGETWTNVSVSLSGGFVCAVRSDATLWCWGTNSVGQLGTGDTVTHASPTRVGSGDRWRSVSAGERHACGIQDDGSLWCWGSNSRGALGTSGGDTAFETLVSLDSDWSSVSAGADQTCALKANGSLWCWGCNGADNACAPQSATPTRHGSATWSAISAGGTSATGQFLCGIRSDGTVWCGGDNTFGQLGRGNASTASHTTPAPLAQVAGLTNATGIRAGAAHVCASTADGGLWCWGSNLDGETGSLTDGATPKKVPVQLASADWAEVLPSSTSTACALNTDGALACWGDNPSTIGDGNQADQPLPEHEALSATWLDGATGGGTCALQTDHSLYCWGPNTYGELGSGATPGTGGTASPLQITADNDWSSVCVGQRHACALKSDGSLWCWGDDASGQLGLPVQATATSPAQVGADVDWDSVACGDFHTCATKTDGTLWCWGSNSRGQLGTSSSFGSFIMTPAQVGTGTSWTNATGGTAFSCGRQNDGSLWCWGDNASGQLGQGASPSSSATPLRVGTGSLWTEAVASGTNVCGLQSDKSLWCWGSNTGTGGVGMLGSGGLGALSVPARVVEDASSPTSFAYQWTSVAVGAGQACGTQSNHALYCWGSNTMGQLGNGAAVKTRPVTSF